MIDLQILSICGQYVDQAIAKAQVSVAQGVKNGTFRECGSAQSRPEQSSDNRQGKQCRPITEATPLSARRKRGLKANGRRVVPPSPKRNATQNPRRSGRSRVTTEANEDKGKRKDQSPVGNNEVIKPHCGLRM